MTTLDQALALHRAGKLLEAEASYRAVLRQQPRHADAHALLGVVLEALGRPQEAVASIKQAMLLDPQAPLFRFYLGNALLAAGDAAGAAQALRVVTQRQPQLAEAHYNLGNALKLLDDKLGAIAAYRACLALQPAAHEARNNLALLISAQGDYAGAYRELQQVLAAVPDYIQARVNYANIADEAGDFALSYEQARLAVAQTPHHTDALFAWGLAAMRQGKATEALQAYDQLLQRVPNHDKAWDNKAQILEAQARFPEAGTAYTRARALKPDDADINYHCALFDLLMGRLTAGFAGYGWRFKAVPNLKRLQHSSAPVWEGGDPSGKTILVTDEQGFGDSLMFFRFLPILRQRGARVIYAARPPLLPLLQGWDGVDELLPASVAAQTPCDAHCAMMDLPHLLHMGECVPNTVPYLPTPTGDLPDIITRQTQRKVGIVWAGNPAHKHDHKRSIPFANFSALFGVPGVRFYNLLRHADLRGDEAQRFASVDVADLGPQITDFAATARLINALDLVIAVDTSTVHLAGALGKPVWVLLPLGPDWRWQTERLDSPWYPTATVGHRRIRRAMPSGIGARFASTDQCRPWRGSRSTRPCSARKPFSTAVCSASIRPASRPAGSTPGARSSRVRTSCSSASAPTATLCPPACRPHSTPKRFATSPASSTPSN